ncbi:TPR repeat-containing protein [Desulfitobacterium dichloroeliminans LMG P-21439]|uniref:TPR repeat-containing protein n=1 Tax=Desulfitobacterium dichloroeliminans (strain LMG P-21439 / DCA1) TaxID=871963 RepID=L0F4V2_DESDL|nr:MobP3 family relaxase [Desulfitobacterium dichloroeliminans]AGA68864.1 TPR repeat-containing protein [Desulfitobacterium dichloroeliminans LMG P-21439]
MPRIILKCRYIKNAVVHLENLVEYVATREGVEMVSQYKRNMLITEKQEKLMADILAQLPDTADLFEYEDYLNQPTAANASEFITAALDQNLDRLSHQEVYVNYIATRPRAEKLGNHGLFSDEDTPLVLSRVAEEVGGHAGNVWTPIISLRREDAARLGYDNTSAWMALIRKQRNIFAEQMKIAPENLRWYAAFHNEGHHPHCHMIVYSVNPREGYVTKSAIDKMRSSLAKEIFQQDLIQIYSEQTAQRNELAEKSREALKEIIGRMDRGVCESETIEALLMHLAERLKHTSGKKQYGYLKAPLKAIVDQIVDELAKNEQVSEAYAKWQEIRNEVLRTYTDKLPDPLPLSRQKEFKHIKNMVISEAMNIGGHHFTFEGDESADILNEETVSTAQEFDSMMTENELTLVTDEAPEDGDDMPPPASEGSFRADSEDAGSGRPHIAWSDRYKEARAFLYGSDELEPYFEQALRLFLPEAEAGNALAMHDLGRMYADGLGVDMDAEAAFSWYEKALSTFLEIEANKENRYVEYRIGKMHAAGLGTKQDYEEAAGWFEMSASRNYKYAQYSLAGLYYRGQGVDQSFENAFELYRRSAGQRVPYADYELAKMHRDGIGTVKNGEEAELHFEEAFYGFKRLEEQSHDDKLQYRLGQMLYSGTGTEKNVEVAIVYFEKAARLGNVHAQYMLSKIYLDVDSGHENAERAVQWLTKAAENGNSLAQYALGKLYRDGSHVEQDMEKAITLFIQSADQENQYAAYALGKLYLNGENIPKDAATAVKWLSVSTELGNQYAQYTLAKLYFTGEDAPQDIPRAVELFTKSALQNNSFAQYQLGKLYLLGEHVTKNAESAVKWLILSAEQGNQYAQYALGKLYLIGRDVPRDREAAIRWLTLSAEQGNIYAQFFLDHLDSFRDPPLFLAATRLLHHLSRIFQEEQRRHSVEPGMQVESKLRRKLREKKIAQGHASDDHELKQTTY